MPWEKNFDVDEARERAMRTFWTRGYDATSMQDLLAAMGIQRGSFYDTFGSKREILLESLRRYDEARAASFAALASRHGPRGAVLALFRQVAVEGRDPEAPKGCLLVNCAGELAPRDPDVAAAVNGAFGQTAAFFEGCLREAVAGAEVRGDVDPVGVSRSLLALLLGLQVLVRAGAPRGQLDAVVRQAEAMLLVPPVRRRRSAV